MTDPQTEKPVVADIVTKGGHPLELKPNTSSGAAKGAKQLPQYERGTGNNGRVIYYDQKNIESNKMELFTHSINNLEIKFPSNWEINEEDNVISLYNPRNEVGALQFTIYTVNNKINIENELKEYIESRHESYEIVKEKTSLVHGYTTGDIEKHWQYWIYFDNPLLVFASYNCAKEDIGKDGEDIKCILENTFNK